MRVFATLVIGILGCSLATLGTQPPAISESEPIRILRKADIACASVGAVQYDVVFDGTGAGEAFFPKITGTYRYEGWAKGWPTHFRIDIEIARRRSATQHISAGFDGTTYYLVDHDARTIRQASDSAILDSVALVLFAGMIPEFVLDRPFDQEIAGREVALLGSESVGSEDCYRVSVVYDFPEVPEATWLIAKNDSLPRGRLDKRDMPNGQSGWQRKRITGLVVNPDWPVGTFTVPSPKGYTRVDGP